MSSATEESFLQQLERQATIQAQLEHRRFFPRQLDPITAFIGKNAWKVLAVLSFFTAFALEIF